LSIDLIQKYFELMGYWIRVIEQRIKRRKSGKGQKDAKEERLKKLITAAEKFCADNEKCGRYIDRVTFVKMLNQTFNGAEDYPRHYQTIRTYQKEVEHKLGIKITKKVPL